MIRITGFLSFNLVLALSLFIAVSAEAYQRSLSFEWEPVPDATGYQVELTPIVEGDKGKPLKYKSKSAAWSGTIEAGSYELRIRSFDDRGVPGEWSEAQALVVALPPLSPIAPKQKQRILSKSDSSEEVVFSWKPMPNAKNYIVNIQSLDGSFKKTLETEEPQVDVDLPVARSYSWSVYGKDSEGQDGDTMDTPIRFVVYGTRVDSPDIDEPSSPYIDKVSWKGAEFSTKHSVLLKYKDNGRWKTVLKQKGQTSSSIDIPAKFPGGEYQISVVSAGSLRRTSEPSRLEFELAKGDRSPAALAQARLKESIQKPTRWYGIASYLVTTLDYTGTDGTSNPQFSSAIGGTGRIGLGYQKGGSKWGYFGIVDMTGFDLGVALDDGAGDIQRDDSGNAITENVRSTYVSYELHATYSTYFWGPNQIQFSGGIYSKEMPFLSAPKVNDVTTEGDINTASHQGIHAGIQYWRPITNQLGVQLYMRTYVGLTGSASTPDGAGDVSGDAFQAGLLGSYRLADKWTGYAGITTREDNIDLNNGGNSASATLSGTYINLKLEVSF